MGDRLKILLIDDHELFRAGIKLLLGDLADTLEFREAATRDDALKLAAAGPYDIVLLDLHLPGVDGLELLASLRAIIEDALIVVLSAADDPALIRRAIDHGAAGFIPKTSTHAVMMAALRLALAGGTYLPPHALLAPRESPNVDQTLRHLTPRQVDALKLAIRGKANKVIARELDISEATVKAHLSASFRALGVNNRTEAVFAAAGAGLMT